MSDFIVVTDGSADLPEELIAQRGITVVPFYVMLGDGPYRRQGSEITTADFYNWMVDNPGVFPKSSAPSAQDYYTVFKPAAEAGEKILCICITTKFSSSYQSALIAREMVRDEVPDAVIQVIDSTVNTVLQGQVVLEACALRDAGASFDDAVRIIGEIKPTGRIFFTIGGIEYLRIGGRIGKLAGKVGSVLGIRPIITLSEGEIHSSGMARGRPRSLDRVLSIARDYLSENFKSGSELSISVGYGYGFDEALAFRGRVQAMLSELGLETEVPIYRIGAVIGVHTGPYPLGVGIVRRACK